MPAAWARSAAACSRCPRASSWSARWVSTATSASRAITRSRKGSSAGSPATSRWALRSLPPVSSSSTCWRRAPISSVVAMAAAIRPASSSSRPDSRACAAMTRWTKPLRASGRSRSTTSDSSRASRSPGLRAAARKMARTFSLGVLAGSAYDIASSRLRAAAIASSSSARPSASRNPPSTRKPSPNASPKTTAADGHTPSCARCLARSACLGCGATGTAGNSSTIRTPAFLSAAVTSASLTAPPRALRSRATALGPTWVTAPASAWASRVSRSSCSRRAWECRSAKLRSVSRPALSSSACAAMSVSARRAYIRRFFSSRQKATTSATCRANAAWSERLAGSPYRAYKSGGGTLPALRAGSSTSARYRSRFQVTRSPRSGPPPRWLSAPPFRPGRRSGSRSGLPARSRPPGCAP